MNIPKSMAERLEYYSSKLEGNPKLQQLYNKGGINNGTKK